MARGVKLFRNGVEQKQADLGYIYGSMNPLAQGQLFPDTKWAIVQKVNPDCPPLATITFSDRAPTDKLTVNWMKHATAVINAGVVAGVVAK